MRRGLGTLSLLLAAAAVPRAGHACSLAGPTPHPIDPVQQATDHQAPMMGQRVMIDIKRGRSPELGCTSGSVGTSCDDIGIIRLSPQATDDHTASANMGYRLSLLSGTLPAGLRLPGGDVRAEPAGMIVLGWSERPDGDPPRIDFTLEVRAVDAAGNVSPPIPVSVRDGEDEGWGCALARPSRRPAVLLAAPLALALALLVRAARRR